MARQSFPSSFFLLAVYFFGGGGFVLFCFDVPSKGDAGHVGPEVGVQASLSDDRALLVVE